MGTLFIVACSEGVEGPLLAHSTRFGWVSRILLQRPVKSLQSPILLRVTRLDTLRRDTQLDPPYRQSRESPKANAGKWRAVVRAYSPGQAILSKHSLERSAHLWPRRSSQTTACQEVPGRRILDRQRVYPHPVSRAEPTLEVHAPHVVGINGLCEWLAPWRGPSTPMPTLDQSRSIQYLSRRARRRPAQLGDLGSQPGHHLLWSPRRVSLLHLNQLSCHHRTRRIGMAAWSSTKVAQTLISTLPKPVDTFVPRLSTDLEPSAQLGDGLFSP